MTFSNQEKQKRFRLKEELSHKARELFNLWQFSRGLDIGRNPLDVKKQLEKIVDLPSGWTNEEYNTALFKLNMFERNALSNNPHLLENDIWDGRKQDPLNAASVRAGKDAITHVRQIVHIINSTFELNHGTNSDNAAAVAEVARNVGVSLISDTTKGGIPRSNATTLCLLVANPILPKPKWLLEALATLLKEQLTEQSSRKLLAEMLLNEATQDSNPQRN